MEKIEDHLNDLNDVELNFDDKFNTMISFISTDWEKFLEINGDNTDDVLFDQITQLLDLHENNNIIDILLVMVKKLYDLPAEAHVKSMIKQFYLYEPISLAMLDLFTSIKMHFEELIKLYINTRNLYIIKNDLEDSTNILEEKIKEWEDINIQNKIETSSIILKFFNGEYSFYLDVKSLNEPEKIRKLYDFKYLGFCVKQPQKRLNALLDFPLEEIVYLIKKMDSDKRFPDYKKIYKDIKHNIMKIEHPKIEDKYIRKLPPNITGRDLVIWYVNEIIELRKSLKKIGNEYNKYYVDYAKNINSLTKIIKKDLIQISL